MWETSPSHSLCIFGEQAVGGRHAGCNDVAQRIEEPALIVAGAVEPGAAGEAAGRDVEHSARRSRASSRRRA